MEVEARGPARRVCRAARLACVVALAAGAAACATPPHGAAPADPLSRGRALLAAGQAEQAREAFRVALALRPDDPQARLGLAAALEGSGELDSAQAIYHELAAARLPGRVRRHLAARLTLLSRRAIQQSARLALANESALSGQPPYPNTIAVMPFAYLGADAAHQPLQRGLAQLLVTDLGRIGALTVLERERIQQILDEIRLTEDVRVDSATAVRSGRLLRAEHIVQGGMFDLPGRVALRVDASVVNSSTAEVAATGSAQDRLDELFALEKEILFQLIRRLGVPVTLAEEQRLAERPTGSLLAFLAYSRGLVAEDEGRFGAAAAEYREAVRLDPAFDAATVAAQRSASLEAAADVEPSVIAGLLDQARFETAFITENLNRVMPSGMENVDRAQAARETGPPGGRDPLGDVGGNDRIEPPRGYGAIDIPVKRP